MQETALAASVRCSLLGTNTPVVEPENRATSSSETKDRNKTIVPGRSDSNGHGVSRWLYRVAVRQALLYRRKNRRYENRISNYKKSNGKAESNGCDNPLQILIAMERRDLVNRALQELSRKDCEVLLLKYREGWSCKEMADRLGASESAMKSRLLRARKNLLARLQQIGVDEDPR